LRSAVGSAVTFGLLVITIDGFGHGVNRTINLLELAGFVVAATLFIRRQKVLAVPMLALDLFKRAVFSLSVTASVTSFVALGAVLVTIPFYFQDVLGFSPVHTGLLMTPWPLTVLLLAKPAGRLADRYPAGLLSTLGMSLLAAGLVALLFLPAVPSTLDVAWRMILCGLGTGLFQSPNNRAMMGSAPLERSGAVSGILAMARTTGQATGAALVALIFGLLERATGLHASHEDVSIALIVAIAFTVVAALASSLRLAEFGRTNPV
jgi:DHA2 family multidrug resistance protein-like MFS transporter